MKKHFNIVKISIMKEWSKWTVVSLLAKVWLWWWCILYVFWSYDRYWFSTRKKMFRTEDIRATKRIVFIRHAESKWNVLFSTPFNLIEFTRNFIYFLCLEVSMLFVPDSNFIDAPLSERGIAQAKKLHRFLNAPPISSCPQVDHLIPLIRKPSNDSVLATSNLRRATETARIMIGDSEMVVLTRKLHVLTSLQEIGNQVDTLSLCQPYGHFSTCGSIDTQRKAIQMLDEKLFDVTESYGNKTLFQNGLRRLHEFTQWAFRRPEKTIIVCGHSVWFRSFFNEFLPMDHHHVAKKQKIVNCGIISFLLHQVHHHDLIYHQIDPNSIVSIYGGFNSATKSNAPKGHQH